MNQTRQREWNVLSMMEWGTDYFASLNIPDPRHSIEWLLAEILEVKRLDLYLQFDRPLSERELEELRPLIKRRAAHEPLQYITGETDFIKARITVSPQVLIPRIETEQLMEIILEREEDAPLRALDIGTGSGCIPIALKLERPQWEMQALELSGPALAVARHNAETNGTEIDFLEGDLFDWRDLPLLGPYDFVVSNPPYVLPGEKESLQKQVVSHEPPSALFCDDLAEMYGAIRDCSRETLGEGGRLYLEIHENHPQQILDLFPASGWKTELLKDYEKKDRFILARKR